MSNVVSLRPPREDTGDGSPEVAVKMTAKAAEELAKACGRASYWASDRADDDRLPKAKREEAMGFYDWLSWGSRWLVEGARIEEPQRIFDLAHELAVTLDGIVDADFGLSQRPKNVGDLLHRARAMGVLSERTNAR